LHTFNPWTDHDPGTDTSRAAPADRLERLQAHLSISARYILIGEAAGYQGCKVSGIAFTSERLILAGQIPRVSTMLDRLTSRARPWSEPSATTVWSTLRALGIAEHTILWNAFPWHPHKPGNLHSNRTPTPKERELGLPVLEQLLNLHPDAMLFAVGRNAEWSLRSIGRDATALRHPSMGGAARYRAQLTSALD
jgi:uracil-DNA glycosylase